jgi:hypothetical protein
LIWKKRDFHKEQFTATPPPFARSQPEEPCRRVPKGWKPKPDEEFDYLICSESFYVGSRYFERNSHVRRTDPLALKLLYESPRLGLSGESREADLRDRKPAVLGAGRENDGARPHLLAALEPDEVKLGTGLERDGPVRRGHAGAELPRLADSATEGPERQLTLDPGVERMP